MAAPQRFDVATFGMPQWGDGSGADFGLERTPFDVGVWRQSQAWKQAWIESRLTWVLPAPLLNQFGQWTATAHSWVLVPMESLLHDTVGWHQVRISSAAVEYTHIGGGMYEASLSVEHRQGVAVEPL